MTDKETMKLALDALETECDIYREHDEDGAPEYILEAITALKERLAQPEQEPKRDMNIKVMRQARNAFVWNLNTDLDNIPACEQWAKMLRKNIDDLDEAIEQAEQNEENT